MRVNLEGEPLVKGITEIMVDSDVSIVKESDTSIILQLGDTDEYSFDVHEVKRLIKGLELAVKEMLKDERESVDH